MTPPGTRARVHDILFSLPRTRFYLPEEIIMQPHRLPVVRAPRCPINFSLYVSLGYHATERRARHRYAESPARFRYTAERRIAQLEATADRVACSARFESRVHRSGETSSLLKLLSFSRTESIIVVVSTVALDDNERIERKDLDKSDRRSSYNINLRFETILFTFLLKCQWTTDNRLFVAKISI